MRWRSGAANRGIDRRAWVGTGYLGGAVATHVRVGDPLVTHVLFPVYVAVFIWGGLLLREKRLRGVLEARQER